MRHRMKIISIVGSPMGIKGNTAALLKIVLDGAESKGAETEIIVIKGSEVKPCKGCDICHINGHCPQKDSFNTIKEKIIGADGLVLASPNYIFHVSAQLKTFIDRCCGVVHCLGFEGKYGASVVTSGGGDEKPIVDYMNHFLAITGVAPVGSIWATMAEIEGQSFKKDTKDRAFSLGERLVTAWQEKENIPEWGPVTAQFRERMKSLMLWRRQEWLHEFQYWKEFRGLDDTV